MRIAGTAYDPAQMPAQIDGTPYAYVTFETLEWLGEPYGFNELHVISTNAWDKAWAEKVVNRVKGKAERSGYTIPLSMTADPGQLPMDDVLQGILLLMGLLGDDVAVPECLPGCQYGHGFCWRSKSQIGVMKGQSAVFQILGMYRSWPCPWLDGLAAGHPAGCQCWASVGTRQHSSISTPVPLRPQ
jgi:hypothetical protein